MIVQEIPLILIGSHINRRILQTNNETLHQSRSIHKAQGSVAKNCRFNKLCRNIHARINSYVADPFTR